MSLYNLLRKPKSLQYRNIISTQHNLYGPLFQNQALIGTKELLSLLVLFARQLILTETNGMA